MKIKISADSTCDLSPELIARYNIGITPLYIVRGDETLRDGIDVRPEELYAYAKATGKLCQTAAVNVSDYLAFFSAARAESLSPRSRCVCARHAQSTALTLSRKQVESPFFSPESTPSAVVLPLPLLPVSA